MKLLVLLLGVLAVDASDEKRSASKNGREHTQNDVLALKEIIGYSNAENLMKIKMVDQRLRVSEPTHASFLKLAMFSTESGNEEDCLQQLNPEELLEQRANDLQQLEETLRKRERRLKLAEEKLKTREKIVQKREQSLNKLVKTLTKRNFAKEFFNSPNLLSMAMVFLDVNEYILIYRMNHATKMTVKKYLIMLNQPGIKELRFEQKYSADSTNDQKDLEAYANFLTRYHKTQWRCAVRQKIIILFLLLCNLINIGYYFWFTKIGIDMFGTFFNVIVLVSFLSILDLGNFRNLFSDSLKLDVRGVPSQFIKLQRKYKCDSFLKQIKACVGENELLKAPFHFLLKVPFPFETTSCAYVLDRIELLPRNHIELVYKRSNTFCSSLYTQIRANYEVVFDDNQAQIFLREVFKNKIFPGSFKHNNFDQIPGFQKNLEASISSCIYKRHFLNDLIRKLKTF